MIEHRRNLPHIYLKEAIFFVTFCLKNSIPLDVLEKMQEEKEIKVSEIRGNNRLSVSEKGLNQFAC